MKQKIVLLSLLVMVTLAVVNMQSCKPFQLLATENNIQMLPKLSDYPIFQGAASELKPAGDFKLYELSTGLFTDYAEKQRLIKVPPGSKLTAINDELPDFPDGTILVKTFYYFNDKRDLSKGKRLIETRLLIKAHSKWNAGTYQWNNDQTEALLITNGMNIPVNWVDKNGTAKAINYHMPGNKECATCHHSDNSIMPIGLKIRNLNTEVTRSNKEINQLLYLEKEGIFDPIDPSSFARLPNWQNKSLPIEERARAYMDINCAHCHSEKGYCSISKLWLGYEIPLHTTQVTEKAKRIDKLMTKKNMPMLGTTIIDEEGLSLIKEYVKNLK